MVTTVMWWMAQQLDPWNPGGEKLLEALQLIWDMIYAKHTQYTITINDPVFYLISPSMSVATDFLIIRLDKPMAL
jgi:hypothetical protein